mmetsp:Transcript_4912/g.10103  ORF Transcript_4912/g.10103 Transcript_4912/m.10103 type:complete len:460 (-) Transcript_4912:189-1568(-)
MNLSLASASLSLLLLGAATAFSPHASLPSFSSSHSASSSGALSMAAGKRLKARPIGIGSCAPSTVLTNFDLESVHDTSDEWIRTRTGISERRVLIHEGTRPVVVHHIEDVDVDEKEKEKEKKEDTQQPPSNENGNENRNEKEKEETTTITQQTELEKETLRTLAVTSARAALAMSKLPASSLDLVICATSSPDDLFGDAPSIAAAIGCDRSKVMAFDLTAACSGFLFGVVTAAKFLEGGNMKNALVLGADALTRWVDWDDRNTCILFGDGAGAMVLTTEEEEEGDDEVENGSEKSNDLAGFGVLGFAAHSDGDGYDELKCIYRGEPKSITTPGEGTIVHDGSYDLMTMNGRKIYSFATREVPTVITEALEQAEITVDQVDWLLLHQANIRIMEVVADRLGIPMEKVITNLYKYGNTSAASIPLALDEAVRSGKVKKGDVIACAGFGAGLSWGAAILKWG